MRKEQYENAANGHAETDEAERRRRRRIRARRKRRRRRRQILILTAAAVVAAVTVDIWKTAVHAGNSAGDPSETSVSGALTAENMPVAPDTVSSGSAENAGQTASGSDFVPLYDSVYEAIDSIEETDPAGAVGSSETSDAAETDDTKDTGNSAGKVSGENGDTKDTGNSAGKASGKNGVRGAAGSEEDETPLYGYGSGKGADSYEYTDTSAEVTDAVEGFGGMELTDAQKKKISAALNEMAGYSVGFILCDINDCRGIVYNPDETYYSASSIKGPYMASVVSMYPECLDTLENEIRQILVYSDNGCYEELRDRYGDAPIEKWAEDAGTEISFDYGWDYTDYSARTLAKLWMKNYEFFESGDAGSEIAELYEDPDTSAIHSVLGNKYTTRSKAGWIADTSCQSTVDAGIVYADNGPYILAILTDIPSAVDRLDPLVTVLDSIHQTM